MMHVSQLQGYPVYEPADDEELAQWRPSGSAVLQFVKVERDEYWIFYAGTFVRCAQRVTGLQVWQAVSDERGCCIAPLTSPLDCAWRLIGLDKEN